MFYQVEACFNIMCDGALQLTNRSLFDTHDNESIYYQLLPAFEEFDQLLAEAKAGADDAPESIAGVPSEAVEEEFEAEEEVADLLHDDPEYIALALETEEYSDEEEKPALTAYYQHRYKLLKLIYQTEQSLVAKRDWKFMGEVTADQRPRDALLDEMPDFEIKRKMPVKIDAAINEQIEQLIKLRILDKKFDNPTYTVYAKKEEREKLSFDKNEKALPDIIQADVIGQRAELPQAVKQLEEEVTAEMQQLEAELRSYFVQYQVVK